MNKNDEKNIEGFDNNMPSLSTLSSSCISCFILMLFVILLVSILKKGTKKH